MGISQTEQVSFLQQEIVLGVRIGVCPKQRGALVSHNVKDLLILQQMSKLIGQFLAHALPLLALKKTCFIF